jgi:hypothetical protein
MFDKLRHAKKSTWVLILLGGSILLLFIVILQTKGVF